MASESDGGVELGKRPHVKTHRMQEFLTTQRQGDGATHKVRVCPVEGCNKTFTSAPGLRYHVRSHDTDQQHFLCDRCKKSFKSNNGLKYHQKNTKCEEFADGPPSENDDHDEPDGGCVLVPDTQSRLEPECDGMDNLRELAIIATGPQSPLLKPSKLPLEKPSGSVVRTLDLTCVCRRQSENSISTSERLPSSVCVESDPKVTSSSPFPSSPHHTESPDALWTHCWPTPVWQGFMKGTLIKFLSPLPSLAEDWHSMEELAERWTGGDKPRSEKEHLLFCEPVGLVLTKLEETDEEERSSMDLYFSTESLSSDLKPVHLLAQCARDHPFFVKDKGWSSCAPQDTERKYGIPCQSLAEQDVCLPPNHPEASFCRSYQLTSLDCTAVMALSSMAQQKKNQERQSLSSPDSPSKEDVFRFDLTKGKRPMNAFMLFAKENRIQYQQQHPSKDNRQISVLLGDEWKKLSQEEKKRYKDKAGLLAKEQKILHPDCWKRKK